MTLALEPGSTLLHYRVVAPLGAGGMGEVYRALDTTLGREVAIKVLPPAVADDADRLARFEREARLLASLNHPNIAAVYGLHRHAGASFLAMELVPGEDLARRLERGPLPLEEALAVARQIADALAAAHEQGVVHRDLKPANVQLAPDGRVKVLDFGLAKGGMDAATSSASELAHSPTLSFNATAEGMILGTAAYMSPEQARGKPVDRRTDVWAFGCVLWEMLTGERLFAGETVSDTIAALLRKEIPWAALPADVSRAVRRLLRRCLERDAARRLHDLADARLELDESGHAEPLPATASLSPASVAAPPSRLPWALAGFALLLALAALVFAWTRRAAPTGGARERPIRFAIADPGLAPEIQAPRLALSPRGDRLFWVARRGGRRVLMTRALDELVSAEIPGSENLDGVATVSPDGSRVAIVTDDAIQWLPVRGGAPTRWANVEQFRGGVLAPDGSLWFSPATEAGILRIGRDDKTPEPLVGPDAGAGERSFRWLALLPDGETVLYTVATAQIQSFDEAEIESWSARTRTRSVVVEQASYPLFLAPDRLLFTRDGGLFEVRLDRDARHALGEPRLVEEGVVTYPLSGMADVALAADGTLAWVAGPIAIPHRRLLEVDRNGRTRPVTAEDGGYQAVRVAPDGRSLAVDVDAAGAQIWIYDRDRGTRVRLTRAWSNNSPVWSPDGQSVFYVTGRGTRFHLDEQRLDGGPAKTRFESDQRIDPSDVSPDGKRLLYTSGRDLYELPLDGAGTPRPLVVSPFGETEARYSPDGRWIVFRSDESGRSEIYAQPVPGPGRRLRISTDRGFNPVWGPDGREIFYATGAANDQVVAVAVTLGPSPQVGRPRLLFRLPGGRIQDLDTAPDGKFLVVVRDPPQEQEAAQIVVARGWEPPPAAPPR